MQAIKLLVGLFQALAILAIIMFTRFHRKDRNASTIVYFIIAGAIITFFCSPSVVEAHGNGAPTSRCESMVPGHWVDAQTTLPPYQIHVDKTAIVPGERVNITLKTLPGQTGFKGFFIMVKEAEDEFATGSGDIPPTNKNYGKFDLKGSDMSQAQPVHCFEQRNSAMTHVVNYVKDSVQLSWIAPKLISEDQAKKQTKHGRPYMQKELKIVATFVQDFWTFWTDVEPVGDVRLQLTDVQAQIPSTSPKSSSGTKPKSGSPTLTTPLPRKGSPTLKVVAALPEHVTLQNRESDIPVDGENLQLDGENGWNYFKRAWGFMVSMLGS